jgi:hypothetical protein
MLHDSTEWEPFGVFPMRMHFSSPDIRPLRAAGTEGYLRG